MRKCWEPTSRFELETCCLRNSCSTPELSRRWAGPSSTGLASVASARTRAGPLAPCARKPQPEPARRPPAPWRSVGAGGRSEPDARCRAWLRCRRRTSSVELRVRQLRARAGRGPEDLASHAGLDRHRSDGATRSCSSMRRPDILRHIERYERLWPRAARDTPIAAVALTNGDLDHVIGLLSLRESQPSRILATSRVRSGLVERNAVLRTLARTPDQVDVDDPRARERGDPRRRGHRAHRAAGRREAARPPGGPARALARRTTSPSGCATSRAAASVVVATALGALDGVEALVAGADAILLDGTFWRDDELIALGLGTRPRAGHGARARRRSRGERQPRGVSRASRRRARAASTRTSTTPTPCCGPTRRSGPQVERAGWEVAFDGMEIEL